MTKIGADAFPYVPPTPQPGEGPDRNIERDMIRKGQATMPNSSTRGPVERAPHDVEVDLGNGFSTRYREGESIPPQHRELPMKRAVDLPDGFTTQEPDDERARGDLADDRVVGKVIADAVG